MKGSSFTLDLWYEIEHLKKPVKFEDQLWRVMLFQFEDRSDLPLSKPITPIRFAIENNIEDHKGSLVAIGYYCVDADIK